MKTALFREGGRSGATYMFEFYPVSPGHDEGPDVWIVQVKNGKPDDSMSLEAAEAGGEFSDGTTVSPLAFAALDEFAGNNGYYA